MPLQHDAFERRASARADVRSQLKHIGHSLEFRSEERVGLVSGRIRVGLRKRFTSSQFQKQITNFSVSLMLSCTVQMMIVS